MARVRGVAAAGGRLAGRALPFLGVGLQTLDTLTNDPYQRYDVGGQLTGNVVGAGIGTFLGGLTGPLAPIAIPVLAGAGSYFGGQFGRENLNLIPDVTPQAKIGTAMKGSEHMAADMALVQNAAVRQRLNDIENDPNPMSQRSKLQQLTADLNGTPAPPMTDREQMFEQFDPSGTVFRGNQAMADADFRRSNEAFRQRADLDFREGNANRSAQQAANLLNYALGESAARKQLISSIYGR